MGKELAAAYASAARVFAEANEALGVDLRRLCFEGPQAELDRTANTQPALLAASIAAHRAGDALRAAGAKRVVGLRASAAFHSPAMRAVASELRRAIDAATWSALRYPIVTNVDGSVHEHARELPELLERQVWSPVQWVLAMRRAAGEG